MKKLLITNDDGIMSDGLIRLVRVAKKYGEVWVVAPESERSAFSHCITLREPIEVRPRADFPVEGVHAYECSGSPADCVRVGGLNVLPERPDVLISGINYGYNAATDIQYSGTLGAAFEGSFQGYHAIAVSESADKCHEIADHYLEQVLDEAMEVRLDYGQVYNINFPHGPLSGCKGILYDRKVSRGMFYTDRYKQTREREDGTMELMVDGRWTAVGEEGTDLAAIVDGYVSVGIVNNVS